VGVSGIDNKGILVEKIANNEFLIHTSEITEKDTKRAYIQM